MAAVVVQVLGETLEWEAVSSFWAGQREGNLSELCLQHPVGGPACPVQHLALWGLSAIVLG